MKVKLSYTGNSICSRKDQQLNSMLILFQLNKAMHKLNYRTKGKNKDSFLQNSPCLVFIMWANKFHPKQHWRGVFLQEGLYLCLLGAVFSMAPLG